MKVLEEQGEVMRSTDENTERDSDEQLRLDLKRAVERATLQLESRALSNPDSDSDETGEEIGYVSELVN